jgi:hypothetical protein
LGFLSRSAGLEENSVWANLALTQKKIVNEIFPVNADEKDILDEEYDSLCAQVVRIWFVVSCMANWSSSSNGSLYSYQCQDKVTLKLFMAIATAGKLEMDLDLVDRLHLEKSFGIAMTVADRLNHRNLTRKKSFGSWLTIYWTTALRLAISRLHSTSPPLTFTWTKSRELNLVGESLRIRISLASRSALMSSTMAKRSSGVVQRRNLATLRKRKEALSSRLIFRWSSSVSRMLMMTTTDDEEEDDDYNR